MEVIDDGVYGCALCIGLGQTGLKRVALNKRSRVYSRVLNLFYA